jgi:hypothetical protein
VDTALPSLNICIAYQWRRAIRVFLTRSPPRAIRRLAISIRAEARKALSTELTSLAIWTVGPDAFFGRGAKVSLVAFAIGRRHARLPLAGLLASALVAVLRTTHITIRACLASLHLDVACPCREVAVFIPSAILVAVVIRGASFANSSVAYALGAMAVCNARCT